MNAFEAGTRKVIPAVLVYVRRSNDDVLMIHRNARPGGTAAGADYHSGKWNGLGGKLEPDESPLDGARRELREESGLDLPESAFKALGVIQFPNFKAHKNEDWIVFVFSARTEREPPLKSGPEGELHWVPARDLLQLNLWAGDRHFIPYVIEDRPMQGTIWYRGEEVVRQWVTAL